ncbi:MAG: trigger factor [Pseudomonadota bacterium]
MQVSLETLGALQRRLHIALPQEQIDAAIQERAKRVAKTAKISGFRPGKAPLNLVLQQYGDTIRSEVISAKLDVSFNDALKQQAIAADSLAGYPQFGAKAGEPQAGFFEFTATFEVMPEIPQADFSSVEIQRPVVTIEDSDIDYTLDVLRRQRAVFATVDRAAQDGDRVSIDFEGRLDGVPFEGGSAQNQRLDVGAKQFLPDFEAGVIGLKAGESKEIKVNFPAEYGAENLAGKQADFTLTMREVQGAQLPELNDEFAKSLGVKTGTLEALRSEVRRNLELELVRRVRENVRDQVFKGLLAIHDLELPQALIAEEIQELKNGALKRFKDMGVQQPTPDMLKNEYFEANAREQVKLRLVLSHLVRKNELKPEVERTRRLVEEASQAYENPPEVTEWVYQNADQLRQFEAAAVEEAFVEWVLGQAKVNDLPQSLSKFYGREENSAAAAASSAAA